MPINITKGQLKGHKTMGMAAHQSRFLALTSRQNSIGLQLTQLSAEKMSLAREMQKVSKDYNEALTQKVLTWSNNAGLNYSKLNYKTFMSPNELNGGTPYFLSDKNGKIVLDSKYAKYAKMISPNGAPVSGDWKNNPMRNAIIGELTGIDTASTVSCSNAENWINKNYLEKNSQGYNTSASVKQKTDEITAFNTWMETTKGAGSSANASVLDYYEYKSEQVTNYNNMLEFYNGIADYYEPLLETTSTKNNDAIEEMKKNILANTEMVDSTTLNLYKRAVNREGVVNCVSFYNAGDDFGYWRKENLKNVINNVNSKIGETNSFFGIDKDGNVWYSKTRDGAGSSYEFVNGLNGVNDRSYQKFIDDFLYNDCFKRSTFEYSTFYFNDYIFNDVNQQNRYNSMYNDFKNAIQDSSIKEELARGFATLCTLQSDGATVQNVNTLIENYKNKVEAGLAKFRDNSGLSQYEKDLISAEINKFEDAYNKNELSGYTSGDNYIESAIQKCIDNIFDALSSDNRYQDLSGFLSYYPTVNTNNYEKLTYPQINTIVNNTKAQLVSGSGSNITAYDQLQTALDNKNIIFSKDQLQQIEFYDKIFDAICSNGWVENNMINDEDFLNNALQNNQYQITTQRLVEGDTFQYCYYSMGSNNEAIGSYKDENNKDVKIYYKPGMNLNYVENLVRNKAQLGSVGSDHYEYSTDLASNFDKIFSVNNSDLEAEALANYEYKKTIINAKEAKIDTRMKTLETEQAAISERKKALESMLKENVERLNIFTA